MGQLEREMADELRSLREAFESQMVTATAALHAELELVEEERVALENEKQLMRQEAGASFPSVVSLNVGGTVFETRASTLRSVPGSFLAAMFSGRYTVDCDGQGRPFIDRDPAVFAHILSWLRDPSAPLDLPTGDAVFLHELHYYGLYEAIMGTSETVVVVAGGERGEGQTSMQSHVEILVSNEWHPIAPMLHPRAGFHLLCLDNHLFAVGGGRASDIQTAIEKYNPATNEWALAGRMLVPRHGFGCVTMGNSMVYLIGGIDTSNNVLASVDSYDAAASMWRPCPPLPSCRMFVACAVLRGKIYTVGGEHEAGKFVDTVERLDPTGGSWQTVASLNVARAGHACATVGGMIYAVGGMDNSLSRLRSVERYDPLANKWTMIAPMTVERAHCCCTVYNGKLLVAGGNSPGYTSLRSVEVYDVQLNVWTLLPALNEARNFAACSSYQTAPTRAAAAAAAGSPRKAKPS